MSNGPSVNNNIDSAVHRVKEEIDDLTEQQSAALRSAVCVGMSPHEAKEYDGRRKRIMSLIQELKLLQGSQ